jgi:hypothetical protein
MSLRGNASEAGMTKQSHFGVSLRGNAGGAGMTKQSHFRAIGEDCFAQAAKRSGARSQRFVTTSTHHRLFFEFLRVLSLLPFAP